MSRSLHAPAVAVCRALICFRACLSSTEKASASLYVVSVRLLKVAVNVFLLPNFWAVCRQGDQTGLEGFVEGKVNAHDAPHHPSPHSPSPAAKLPGLLKWHAASVTGPCQANQSQAQLYSTDYGELTECPRKNLLRKPGPQQHHSRCFIGGLSLLLGAWPRV